MKYLAVFASFDKDSVVHPYVIYYLRELSKVADIIFVTDNFLGGDEIEKVKKFTVAQICQKHGEYDFGSYKRGYLYALNERMLDKYDRLILCNDSVFGPFYPFKSIISNFRDCDFWGVFKHLKQGRVAEHIQSYFMCFEREVYLSKVFQDFMLSIEKEDDKQKIINKYEIGLSQVLLRAGFVCKALMEDKVNQTHSNDALRIIENCFPFLKRSLFDNRYFYQKAYCRNIHKYKEIITKICPQYNVQSIEEYLILFLGKRKYFGYLRGLKYHTLIDWKRILFQEKITNSGRLLIKICKLPIIWKKVR